MVEGLDKDLQLSVAVEVGHGGRGRGAVAVAVVAGVRQGHVKQQRAIGGQDDEMAVSVTSGSPKVVKMISGEPSWFRSAIIGSEANMIALPLV